MVSFTNLQVYGVPVVTYLLVGITTGVLAYATSIGGIEKVSENAAKTLGDVTENPAGVLSNLSSPKEMDESAPTAAEESAPTAAEESAPTAAEESAPTAAEESDTTKEGSKMGGKKRKKKKTPKSRSKTKSKKNKKNTKRSHK